MTPQHWWLRRVRAGGHERGATLLLALIFITVISVAVVAMLTVAFANIRATTALREQAAAEAAADGAAQIAINALRRGEFSCPGAPNTLALPPISDGTISAAVQCTPDPSNSQGSAHPDFPWALLTLPATGEDGMLVDVNGPSNDTPVVFAGNVGSSGHVFAKRGIVDITGDGALTAVSCAISNQGSIRINATTYTASSPDPPGCGSSAPTDPDLDLPVDGDADPLPPLFNPLPAYHKRGGGLPGTTCVKTGNPDNRTARIEFRPGVYLNPGSLNDASDCAADVENVVIDFAPGTYWFDFPASDAVWSVTGGSLTAGCGAGGGVLFILGDHSRWRIGGDAQVQVCARRPATNDPPSAPGTEPPAVAIYGLRPDDVDASLWWANPQDGCVIAANGCKALEIISTHPTLRPRVEIEGAIYLPLSWIDIRLQGTGTYDGSFGGIVARRFSLHSQSSLTFSSAMSTSPPGPEAARAVVDLTVYVCPGTDTCDTSGTARLTAKVALIDEPTGRRVSIYAWNAAT